jgi:hypothetical protein
MAYPEDHGDFILNTDACDSSIGAVLSQIQNGRLRISNAMFRSRSVFNSKIKCRKDFNPSGNPSFGFFKAKEPNQCLVICSDSKSSAQKVLSQNSSPFKKMMKI